MRMAGALCCVAWTACAAVSDHARETSGAALLVELGDDGSAVRLRALRAELGLVERGRPMRLLEYAAPLDALGLAVDDAGEIELLPADAILDEAWSLPRPDAWAAFDAEPLEEAELLKWLASFTARRRPCRSVIGFRPIGGLPRGGGVNFAARLDDAIFLGVGPSDEFGNGLYRVAVDATEARPILPRTPRRAGFVPVPAGFVDDGRVEVLWFDEDTAARTLLAFDASGALTSSVGVPESSGLFAMHVTRAARRGGPLVAITANNEAGPSYSLMSLGEDLSWRTLARIPIVPTCNVGVTSTLLALSGPTEGLANLQGGPLLALDGDRVTPSAVSTIGEVLCRSAYARLADGSEVIATETPQHEFGANDLFLRRPDEGAWTQFESRVDADAQAMATMGELLLVSGGSSSVAMYEDLRERPALPPRTCGSYNSGVNAFHILAIDDDTALIAGLDASIAAYLDFEPR